MEQLKFLTSFFATENEFYEWGYNINDPMTQPLFFWKGWVTGIAYSLPFMVVLTQNIYSEDFLRK